jgi:ATP-binding cassette subfamily F protein 3
VIRLEDVTLAPGGDDLVREVTFHLRPGDHVGLIGRNGTGKTTLLRAIVGELRPDAGQIHVRSGIRVGWLPQQAVSGSVRPLWDEVQSGMIRINQLREEVADAARAVERDPGQAGRLAEVTERFRLAGGYAADQQVGEVLHGLGFSPEDWRKSCDTFSGGWQMRIALARLLLSEPDVALLDEPTNHLDVEARSWLAGFLAKASWAFLLVSHDRWLLDRCVRRIVELRGRRAQVFAGNFSQFLVERESRTLQLEREFAQQQQEIAHLERFVERFGAKATKAAAAKSKQKALDRIDRIEMPEADRKKARIKLPEAPAGAFDAVGLEKVSLGYPGGEPIVSGLTFHLERGQRVALLGPNGCGKSTLLQTLAGRLKPLAGRRRVGDRTRIGVFAQDLAQALPQDLSPVTHMTTECPTIPPERIRAVLGALGLPGDMGLRRIGELSGGEKARVALSLLVVRPCNVLLLDEPTNHLDAETVDVLAEALADYDGALLFVTHDRFLVERVATHVARLRRGPGDTAVLDMHEGVLPQDFEREPMVREAQALSAPAQAHADRKKRQRELERARRRLNEVQGEILEAEAAVAKIDEALIAAATDHVQATRLARERDAATSKVEALYGEWESLETQLADSA